MNRIYSYYMVCIGILCVLVLTGSALAESRFEKGFREIAWGTHKDQLPDLGLSKKALQNIYKTGQSSAIFMAGRGHLAMEIEGIPLLSIFLNFHDQTLFGVDLVFSPEYRERIHALMARETGSEGVETETENQWKTETLTIILTDHELIIKSEAFNPDKAASGSIPVGPLQDIPCCPAQG